MMADYFHMENSMGRYFRSLPKSVQESILQSGVVFRTEADMRRVADYIAGESPRCIGNPRARAFFNVRAFFCFCTVQFLDIFS